MTRWTLVLLGLLLVGSLGVGYASITGAATDVGYRDFSYSAPGVSAPTGEKPQSKLWYNDGLWWGVLFNKPTDAYHIYRFDWATQTWSDTGILVDTRDSSKADTLWDGTHLYIVSAVMIGINSTDPTTSADSARLLRFSYDALTKSYSLDTGFPVTITNGGMETITLAKDTVGTLWVTFTLQNQVYVNHSQGNDATWGTPYVLPVAGATALMPDDISAVVAFTSRFGSYVGIRWRTQTNPSVAS